MSLDPEADVPGGLRHVFGFERETQHVVPAGISDIDLDRHVAAFRIPRFRHLKGCRACEIVLAVDEPRDGATEPLLIYPTVDSILESAVAGQIDGRLFLLWLHSYAGTTDPR